jgi:CubicO group peptidase (beta-lactamase class C family)
MFRKIDRLVERARASSRLGECVLGLETGDGTTSYRFGPGDRPFFIASATKLYVVALLVRLRERGLVDWDAPFVSYLPGLDTTRLHVLRGIDYTPRITIRHLLSHTSGLPDYFEGRRHDGRPIVERVLARDFGWTVEHVMEWSRAQQHPAFVPGEVGRALYSDTNYQLLGAIIEHACKLPFSDALTNEITRPLGLGATWCFTPATSRRYGEVAAMRHGSRELQIPLAMASVSADGGVVSTVDDSMRFLRAFFRGGLVSEPVLQELQGTWRRIFFPLKYGLGVMRFSVPMILSPFRRLPALIGHSGASGAFMFWCPQQDVFVSGTVNQMANRSLPYRLMLQAITIFPEEIRAARARSTPPHGR